MFQKWLRPNRVPSRDMSGVALPRTILQDFAFPEAGPSLGGLFCPNSTLTVDITSAAVGWASGRIAGNESVISSRRWAK